MYSIFFATNLAKQQCYGDTGNRTTDELCSVKDAVRVRLTLTNISISKFFLFYTIMAEHVIRN